MSVIMAHPGWSEALVRRSAILLLYEGSASAQVGSGASSGCHVVLACCMPAGPTWFQRVDSAQRPHQH